MSSKKRMRSNADRTIEIVGLDSIHQSFDEFGSVTCSRARLAEPVASSPSTCPTSARQNRRKMDGDSPIERTILVPLPLFLALVTSLRRTSLSLPSHVSPDEELGIAKARVIARRQSGPNGGASTRNIPKYMMSNFPKSNLSGGLVPALHPG